MAKRRATARVGLVVAYVALGAATIATLTPLVWMLTCSFKPGSEIFSPPKSVTEVRKQNPDDPLAHPPLHRLMADVIWPDKAVPDVETGEVHRYGDNYRRLLTEIPFGRFLVNSAFVATAQTLLTLFFCSLGGYAFAKYVFVGRGPMFAIVLGSMMIPFHVLLVPLFAEMSAFNWFDTFRALIIPFSAGAFGIFLVRQYARTVPDDLIDAARIDGASEFGIYWRIVLPLIKPALGAMTIFTFMASWNNFMWPLIVLRSQAKYTLPLGLANLVGVYSQEYGMLMAGTLLSTLPIIVLFLFMQREFVSGITLGAVKE